MLKIEYMLRGETLKVEFFKFVFKINIGVDCKMIGPETKCFCNHRYKEHNHLEPKDKKVSCKK